MPNSESLRRAKPARRPCLAPANQAEIEKERNRLFDELMLLRRMQSAPSQALETARILLTRQWIKADWRERERLNKAAGWALQIELNGNQSSA